MAYDTIRNFSREIDVDADGLVDKIDLNVIDTDQLVDSAVTKNKINGGAVTSGKIRNDAVNSNKIEDGAVTNSKISAEVPLGFSSNEIRTQFNLFARDIAENRFENGLDALNYPGGLYDIFIDESKIASSTNIDFSNQKVSLINQASNYVAPSASTGFDYTSSYFRGIKINPNKDLTKIEVVLYQGMNCSEVKLQDGSHNDIATKTGTFTGGDTVTFNQSLTAGTNYYIVAGGSSPSLEYGANPFPVSTEYSDVPTGYDQGNGDIDDWGCFSEVTFSAGGQATSGTFSSTIQDKGYSATEATLTAEYSLNGQIIDSFELKDSSGTTLATWTESEIGDSKPVSTGDTAYQVRGNLSGDGTDTPTIDSYEMGLDD